MRLSTLTLIVLYVLAQFVAYDPSTIRAICPYTLQGEHELAEDCEIRQPGLVIWNGVAKVGRPAQVRVSRLLPQTQSGTSAEPLRVLSSSEALQVLFISGSGPRHGRRGPGGVPEGFGRGRIGREGNSPYIKGVDGNMNVLSKKFMTT